MSAPPARARAWLAALALSVSAPAFGQSTSPPAAAPPTAAEAVTKRLDPTDFKTRFETRLEYQSLQDDGGSRTLLVPRYEHAFSKTLGARIELPYVWVDPDQPGVSGEHGIGDMVLRLNSRVARGAGYAVVVSPELALDTASDDRLGTGKYVFQPVAYASIDAPRFKSVVFPYVQQFWSIAGDDDRRDINTTLLRIGLLSRWPNRFYTFVEPSLYIDWERDGDTGFTLELEIGRLFTRNLALWARPGVGVSGDLPVVYDWNFEVGFRYFLD
jgi:hypothetical protein